MSLLRRVERELDERLRKLFSSGGEAQGLEAIEVYRAILDQVAAKVQTLPKGKRAFPYNHLTVRIPVADAEGRPAADAAFVQGNPFFSAIQDRLRQEGCEPPADLETEVSIEERPGQAEVVFEKREAPKPEVVAPPPLQPARLRLVAGKAVSDVCTLSPGRTNIGRLADLLDDRQRLVRRNDVVFLEGDDPANGTVSRAHAHIQFDSGSGEYRLYDDRSAYGTSLFREGKLIQAPSGVGPGIALRPGDEIYFGQTRMRFEIGAEEVA